MARPAAPRELTQVVARAKESVSRELSEMLRCGFVSATRDPDDRRVRLYALTTLGEARAADLITFGTPAVPPPLPADVACRALHQALDAAVELRRKTSRREETLERLHAVTIQATDACAPGVTLEAVNEILTTLRQSGREAEMLPYLDRLGQFASATDPSADPTLILPAVGYLEYQLGRSKTEPLVTRVGRLLTACTVFARLGGEESDGHWRRCQAWAHAAIADNLRQQSELGAAIVSANEAASIFHAVGDSYGATRTSFLLGFCLRLRGQFIEASSYLHDAHRTAIDHGFSAFAADSLMQLGEVYRCQGDLTTATSMLGDARERARILRLPLTQAFADSALAAATHEQGDDNTALAGLSKAEELFAERGHRDGIALNLRRKAIVLRRGATNRGDLDAAGEFLARARVLYGELRSPAGVVACGIEGGYLKLAYRQDANEDCDQLIRHLRGPSMRHMVELDPWVPRILLKFAEDAEHGELRVQALELLERSDLRLAVHEAEALPSEVAGRGPTVDAKPRNRRALNLMAGEPRRLRYGPVVAAAPVSLSISQPVDPEWCFA